MSRFAVVPSAGCYSQSSRVRAISTHATLLNARRAAARATREYRAAMRSVGGSSGYYRVVATDAATTRDAVWQFGHDLDREVSL